MSLSQTQIMTVTRDDGHVATIGYKFLVDADGVEMKLHPDLWTAARESGVGMEALIIAAVEIGQNHAALGGRPFDVHRTRKAIIFMYK